MEEKEIEKRDELLKLLQTSPLITIVEACKIVGIHRNTYYFYLQTDANFKREILKIKQEKLAAQIATAV